MNSQYTKAMLMSRISIIGYKQQKPGQWTHTNTCILWKALSEIKLISMHIHKYILCI